MLINKHDIVESIPELDGISYDTALPIQWVDYVNSRILLDENENVSVHFVWVYPDKEIFGFPFALDMRGKEILGKLASIIH